MLPPQSVQKCMLRRRSCRRVVSSHKVWSAELIRIIPGGAGTPSGTRVLPRKLLPQGISTLPPMISFNRRAHPPAANGLRTHKRINCSCGADDLISLVNAVMRAGHCGSHGVLDCLNRCHFLFRLIQIAAALAAIAPDAAPAGPPASPPVTPPIIPAPTGRITSQLR